MSITQSLALLTYLPRRIRRVIDRLRPSRWRVSLEINSRQKWDNEARWYRLRYSSNEKARDMVNRLGKVGSRIGFRLRYTDGGSVEFWIGIEPYYAPALLKMATDFECVLSTDEQPPTPLAGSFMTGQSFPDKYEAIDAYVVEGKLFILPKASQEIIRIDDTPFTGSGDSEIFFPAPAHAAETVSEKMEVNTGVPGLVSSSANQSGGWQMPSPVLGIATQVHLALPATPVMFRQSQRGEWLLGWDEEGKSIGARRIGVIGTGHALNSYLQSLILAGIREGKKGLVVIDGKGNLVRHLTKHPHIKQMMLQGEASLLDVVQSARQGFNPMAWPLEVNRHALTMRWQWWLGGMGIPKNVIDRLVPAAVEDEITNIPEFYRWLSGKKRKHPGDVTAVQIKIEALDKDGGVRDWILRPDRFVDPRLLAKRGLLLINGQTNEGSHWARTQALRSLLGLLIEIDPSMVIHDFKLEEEDRRLLRRVKLAISNTLLAGTFVVTRCDQRTASAIVRHLPDGNVAAEHLVLLPDKTGVVKKQDCTALVSWKKG